MRCMTCMRCMLPWRGLIHAAAEVTAAPMHVPTACIGKMGVTVTPILPIQAVGTYIGAAVAQPAALGPRRGWPRVVWLQGNIVCCLAQPVCYTVTS
jgi:hypothetical protein